jgi:hypothetical protein
MKPMELIDTHCHLAFEQFAKSCQPFAGFYVYNNDGP